MRAGLVKDAERVPIERIRKTGGRIGRCAERNTGIVGARERRVRLEEWGEAISDAPLLQGGGGKGGKRDDYFLKRRRAAGSGSIVLSGSLFFGWRGVGHQALRRGILSQYREQLSQRRAGTRKMKVSNWAGLTVGHDLRKDVFASLSHPTDSFSYPIQPTRPLSQTSSGPSSTFRISPRSRSHW